MTLFSWRNMHPGLISHIQSWQKIRKNFPWMSGFLKLTSHLTSMILNSLFQNLNLCHTSSTKNFDWFEGDTFCFTPHRFKFLYDICLVWTSPDQKMEHPSGYRFNWNHSYQLGHCFFWVYLPGTRQQGGERSVWWPFRSISIKDDSGSNHPDSIFDLRHFYFQDW